MDGMEEVSDKLKEFGYKGEEEKLCKELLEAISEMDVDACVEIMEKWRQVR